MCEQQDHDNYGDMLFAGMLTNYEKKPSRHRQRHETGDLVGYVEVKLHSHQKRSPMSPAGAFQVVSHVPTDHDYSHCLLSPSLQHEEKKKNTSMR